MEAMYKKYRDKVEFRLVYIKEAHAADSNWSVPYAKKLGIKNHVNFGERCKVATRLVADKKLTIPCVIDVMEDRVNLAYSAFPDRLFIVRTDGRLAVAAARGPRGFSPALKEAQKWLAQYAKAQQQPPLPKGAAPAGRDRNVTPGAKKSVAKQDT